MRALATFKRRLIYQVYVRDLLVRFLKWSVFKEGENFDPMLLNHQSVKIKNEIIQFLINVYLLFEKFLKLLFYSYQINIL